MDAALDMLRHCQRVESGQLDFRTLAVFATYGGVEMFQAAIGKNFVIYAVEVDPAGDLKVTIMFAGQHGIPLRSSTFVWNGTDYPALASSLIAARAAAWFT
ncbi:MAG: hypothetical protein JOZ16_14000 [Methylobacteriaceae bacterium]|nr:hypothetical protein [Methylobacteriaceae bacterium]